jgi:Cu+-exporting ATPase
MTAKSHHEEEKTHSCCGGGPAHEHTADVQPSATAKYFCPMCEGVESDRPGTCAKCGMALERNPLWSPAATTIYTCPMHPEIEQDAPGSCPICGMALELKTVSSGDAEENEELTDMSRRFWISAVLTLPVFLLGMSHMLPNAPMWTMADASRWTQFLLSMPVVLWGGWPFFQRGWLSIRTGHLNMFTLIAIGVATAFLYSAVVMLAPGIFPESFREHGKIGIYFEAAAMITVLVLLGQVLELRARARTGAAIRALLDLAPKTARRVRNGRDEDVPVEQIQSGDLLRVRPGEKIPVDGHRKRRREHGRRIDDHWRADARAEKPQAIASPAAP